MPEPDTDVISKTAAAARIAVIADDRERGGPVVARLRDCPGFSLHIQRLPLGDYRVDDRFLFERKTLSDLAASLVSGRLFSQALRLAALETIRPALILEGTLADWRNSQVCREAVQGALVTLTLFFGLPVLRARSAGESVAIMRYAAEQGRAAGCRSFQRPGRRPKGKAAVQRRILQTLPGVGPARAERLLRRFGSVRAVMAADKDALRDVEGIGETVAERINWAVREPPARYAQSATS